MIDVSTFLLGDRCPRCVQRRVYAIDPERNLWMCVPNAMPVAMKEHVIEHDAAEWDHVPADARHRYAEEMTMMMKNSTQHPRGAGYGR